MPFTPNRLNDHKGLNRLLGHLARVHLTEDEALTVIRRVLYSVPNQQGKLDAVIDALRIFP